MYTQSIHVVIIKSWRNSSERQQAHIKFRCSEWTCDIDHVWSFFFRSLLMKYCRNGCFISAWLTAPLCSWNVWKSLHSLSIASRMYISSVKMRWKGWLSTSTGSMVLSVQLQPSQSCSKDILPEQMMPPDTRIDAIQILQYFINWWLNN